MIERVAARCACAGRFPDIDSSEADRAPVHAIDRLPSPRKDAACAASARRAKRYDAISVFRRDLPYFSIKRARASSASGAPEDRKAKALGWAGGSPPVPASASMIAPEPMISTSACAPRKRQAMAGMKYTSDATKETGRRTAPNFSGAAKVSRYKPLRGARRLAPRAIVLRRASLPFSNSPRLVAWQSIQFLQDVRSRRRSHLAVASRNDGHQWSRHPYGAGRQPVLCRRRLGAAPRGWVAAAHWTIIFFSGVDLAAMTCAGTSSTLIRTSKRRWDSFASRPRNVLR